jgi:elongation factor 3
MVFLEPPQSILTLLREALPDDTAAAAAATNVDGDNEEILAYVASLASSLADSQNWDCHAWVQELSPYLLATTTNATSSSTENDSIVENTITQFHQSVNSTLNHADDESSDEDDEFGGEELMNLRFSLAYGGKILLHQTKLRLRRGHRYALVGQNGVGKTTLMNAINGGKLEGWPSELLTEYVDSGSNVDPVHEAKIVFDHLLAVTKKSREECVSLLQDQLKFTNVMMSGSIGELSGGWQMKLRLAQAVLINADILLLDEPTNHLDSKTVQWLIEYLKGLIDTTVLIVSHDTPFLEEVCSDGKKVNAVLLRRL